MMKYFTVDSVEYLFFFVSRGRKAKVFTSMANQIVIGVLADRASMEEVMIVNINIEVEGCTNIFNVYLVYCMVSFNLRVRMSLFKLFINCK